MNSGPEIVDAVSGWAKIRGVLGALLGGFAVSFALLELLFSGPDQMRGYGILLGLFNSFGAAFGYWLFRGPRDRRFASRTVYFTTALTPFLAVPVRLILYALRLMGWPPAASPGGRDKGGKGSATRAWGNFPPPKKTGPNPPGA